MGIFKDRGVQVPDDVGEAIALRAEATDEHRKTLIRGFSISQLAAELSARRELNGFGDSLQITFLRRTG